MLLKDQSDICPAENLRPGLTIVRITRNCVMIIVNYPLVMNSHTLIGWNT